MELCDILFCWSYIHIFMLNANFSGNHNSLCVKSICLSHKLDDRKRIAQLTFFCLHTKCTLYKCKSLNQRDEFFGEIRLVIEITMITQEIYNQERLYLCFFAGHKMPIYWGEGDHSVGEKSGTSGYKGAPNYISCLPIIHSPVTDHQPPAMSY